MVAPCSHGRFPCNESCSASASNLPYIERRSMLHLHIGFVPILNIRRNQHAVVYINLRRAPVLVLCYTPSMSKQRRRSVSEEQWQVAAEDFELGTKHAVEIAIDLGVSAATVSRQLKRRGCIKGSRVEEAIAGLKAELDAKARIRAHRRRLEESAATARLEAMNELIGEMIKSLIASDRAGDLRTMGPAVEQIHRAVGGRRLR